MQLTQPLTENEIARFYAFEREYEALLKENPGVLNVSWFSDEARLYLDCYD
jgi:hypothetical protein